MKNIIIAAAALGLLATEPVSAAGTPSTLAGKSESEQYREATTIHPQLEEELSCFIEGDNIPRGRELNALVGKLRD